MDERVRHHFAVSGGGGVVEWEGIIREGVTKDGRRYHLRHLHWGDLEQLMDFINSVVEAKAEIAFNTKVTREGEEEWLKHALEEEEKGITRHYLAEMEHKIISNAYLQRGRPELSQPHLASLGIAIRPGFWDQGIGTAMMRIMIEDARRWGLKIVILDVFATNLRAIHVYEKLGFREVGRVPKGILRDQKYIDLIRMAIEL